MEDKGYVPGEPRWYTPRARGNRESAEPMRVEIITPKYAERRRILYEMGSVPDATKESLAAVLEASDRWQENAVRKHVRSVTGYISRGQQITTGEDLLTHGHWDMVMDVASEIWEEGSLDEEEKKTSGRPSVSSEPGTAPSTGTAGDAGKAGAQSNGAAHVARPLSLAGDTSPA